METLKNDNIECLRQGISLLQRLDDDLYTRPNAACFNSTIGGHIRHNTDHYECFLRGYQDGTVDYDGRTRDVRVQNEAQFACDLMQRIISALEELPESQLEQPLQVKMDSGGADDWSGSTIRRELQFLLSHTIHHFALIATIARLEGMDALPPHFGVAPSTLKHETR